MSIERFIEEHRGAFDTAMLAAEVWAAIARQLDRWSEADGLARYIAQHRFLFDDGGPQAQLWGRIAEQLPSPHDPLETFIAQNRAALDTQEPDPRLWPKLLRPLPPSHTARLRWLRPLRLTAAAITLLLTGVALGLWYGHRQTASTPKLTLSDLSPEYAEAERYFQREIRQRKHRLGHFSLSYSRNTVMEDLRQMDIAMAELQAELAQVPPTQREPIIRAMIENYKARIAILERVLQYLERQNKAPTNSGDHDTEKI